MKFLIMYAALCYICIIVAAQSDSIQGDTEAAETSQSDGNQISTPNEAANQPLVKGTKVQQKPYLPLSQNHVPNYPALSQFNLNYQNRQRPLIYEHPAAGNLLYGNPQQVTMYPNYPTQAYVPYSYGYDQRRQPVTWNPPLEPLLGNKYWEYPTAKPKKQITDSPPGKAISGWVPQPYNKQQIPYWVAPVRTPKMDPSWYSMPRQPFYYGRRPAVRRPYQPAVRNGWYPQTIPPTPKPKPSAFDPTSEQHFLAEYSTGSIQESDSGLQLILDEAEKGNEGNTNVFPNSMGWPNYPITRPAWPLPRPVVPQPPKPSNVDNWKPRPDYFIPTARPDYFIPTETPDKAAKDKRICLMNCRRRCGLGYGNSNGCSWNSGCGRSQWGCGGSIPNYRPNSNGVNWRYRNTGQYWGAASQWNNPTKEQGQTAEELNKPSTETTEEKPCGPELPNSGQWKWIENNWKWVCNEEAPTEDSEQNTVIDA